MIVEMCKRILINNDMYKRAEEYIYRLESMDLVAI